MQLLYTMGVLSGYEPQHTPSRTTYTVYFGLSRQ